MELAQGPEPQTSPTQRAAERFIARNLHLGAVPGLPRILIHTAHARSRLSRLLAEDAPPPYWAYLWAGGLSIARYLAECPEAVRGKRVVDVGAGSGVASVGACLAGADVTAIEIDANGRAAIAQNAAANGVRIDVRGHDILDGATPGGVQVILVGDMFYEQVLAGRLGRFLDRCRSAGVDIVVGDPGRKYLPLDRLEPIREYFVTDFGLDSATLSTKSTVYSWRPSQA